MDSLLYKASDSVEVVNRLEKNGKLESLRQSLTDQLKENVRLIAEHLCVVHS
jgi:hypothetical protein